MVESSAHAGDRFSIPGPPPHRLFGPRGNLFLFMRDPIGYMQALHRDHGEIVSFVKGSPGIIFAFGPAYNQLLLGNPAKFQVTGITLPGPEGSAQRRLGCNLLSMNGELHKEQRRQVTPAFQTRCFEIYRDQIVTITQTMLDGWRPDTFRDIAEDMKDHTLRVASRILFGLDPNSRIYAVGSMIDRWMTMNTSNSVRLLCADRWWTPYRRMLNFAERLEQQILGMIADKRTQANSSTDVLALLLAGNADAGAAKDDATLVGQACILFAAAYETTSNALTWTLFLLSQHPAIAADLHDEIATLRGEAPDVAKLAELRLLDRVVRESLRILPPAIYNSRLAIEPFTLGGVDLPEKTTVAFSNYITHHMPEIFPEPERFRPDRWLDIKPSCYEYLPFGAGPRMCIGTVFAPLMMKITLCMTLQRFRLALPPRARVDRQVSVTLAPKGGMRMIVRNQDRRFTRSEVRGNIREMVALS